VSVEFQFPFGTWHHRCPKRIPGMPGRRLCLKTPETPIQSNIYLCFRHFDLRFFPPGDSRMREWTGIHTLEIRLKPTIDNEIPRSQGLRGIFILQPFFFCNHGSNPTFCLPLKNSQFVWNIFYCTFYNAKFPVLCFFGVGNFLYHVFRCLCLS
jgi:hypothetical protein